MRFLKTKKGVAFILSFMFMLTLVQVPFEVSADIAVTETTDTRDLDNNIERVSAPSRVNLFDTAQFELELGGDVDEVKVIFYWNEGNKENKYEEYYQVEEVGTLTIDRVLRFKNYYTIEFVPMVEGKLYEENSSRSTLRVNSDEEKFIKSITGNDDVNSTNIENV